MIKTKILIIAAMRAPVSNNRNCSRMKIIIMIGLMVKLRNNKIFTHSSTKTKIEK